jgi:hypothetical protein
MWFRLLVCVSVAVSTAGCGSAPAPASSATSSASKTTPRAADTGPARETPPEETPGAFPEGLHPDAVCAEPSTSEPPVPPAAATALVPLIEGLTLSQTWIPRAGDYEHECLVQITKVDDSSAATGSATIATSRQRAGDAPDHTSYLMA